MGSAQGGDDEFQVQGFDDRRPARQEIQRSRPARFRHVRSGTAKTGTEEDEEKDCAQGTATNNEPAYAPRTVVNLALLRRQLHEALSSTRRPEASRDGRVAVP